MPKDVPDTGLSVVYETESRPPIIDIVFVHGLQGHPSKTWTYRRKTPDAIEWTALTDRKEKKRSVIRRMIRKMSKLSSTDVNELAATTVPEGNDAQFKPVFWPADLLPNKCPDSRILTFGYDSKVTKYKAGEINQNSILSHGKDLLFDLRRRREGDPSRPLLFVAHSLGGIVVKEMLARSSSSTETELRNIVESTALVVFLGTPHRGSQDVAAFGEVARSVVASLGMKTTPVILNALGLKNTDLVRVQEDFSTIWHKYDFQVKTFQEGLILAKLGKKVVPEYSSLIGDYREQAETLQANHSEMCRYPGKDDPSYRKVAGELEWIYHSVTKKKKKKMAESPQILQRLPDVGSGLDPTSTKEPPHVVNGSNFNDDCLASLWFPVMSSRYQSLERPTDNTCSWLFNHELYRDWFNGNNKSKSYGLLWLKGKPGSGKSTLMKEAFRQAALKQIDLDYCTAAFFFSAQGDKLEHSSLGLFKSLLYQLLPEDGKAFRQFHEKWEDKNKHMRNKLVTPGRGEEKLTWETEELRFFLESQLTSQKKKMIIFVDALDECHENEKRSIAYLWRSITKDAYRKGVDLNVCISSRHFPTITLSNCPEIIVEQHNSGDIQTYVDHKFQLVFGTGRPPSELLKKHILQKSAGVFFWVVLVVEDILKSWDEGRGMPFLIKRVMDVPEELETLFSNMFSALEPHTKELSVKFFQWATLATKPLRLHEWRHILAFIRQPAPKSLIELRQSDNLIENDEQLEKQIRKISRGLVEVRKFGAGDSKDTVDEFVSINAGAGSLSLDHGDTRIVQVIHESVRDFFLRSNGFSVLDSGLEANPVGKGHLSIMATCLDYINITELDALVKARIDAAGSEKYERSKSNQGDSGSSFCSHSRGFPGEDGDALPNANNQPSAMQLDHQSATGVGKTFTFEMLTSLQYSIPRIDIVAWMTNNDTDSAGHVYTDGFHSNSDTYSFYMGQPRLLEDDPVLLPYATFKLFTHARLAEICEIDLSPIIDRLKDEATWTRWVALREDIPNETTVGSYLREHLWYRHCSSGSSESLTHPKKRRYPVHQTRSVASFSSAGSHIS